MDNPKKITIDADHYVLPLISAIKAFIPQFVVLLILYFISPLLAFILGQFLILFMILIGRYSRFAEELYKNGKRS